MDITLGTVLLITVVQTRRQTIFLRVFSILEPSFWLLFNRADVVRYFRQNTDNCWAQNDRQNFYTWKKAESKIKLIQYPYNVFPPTLGWKLRAFLKLLTTQVLHTSTNKFADIKELRGFEASPNLWAIITSQKHSPTFTDKEMKIERGHALPHLSYQMEFQEQWIWLGGVQMICLRSQQKIKDGGRAGTQDFPFLCTWTTLDL